MNKQERLEQLIMQGTLHDFYAECLIRHDSIFTGDKNIGYVGGTGAYLKNHVSALPDWVTRKSSAKYIHARDGNPFKVDIYGLAGPSTKQPGTWVCIMDLMACLRSPATRMVNVQQKSAIITG